MANIKNHKSSHYTAGYSKYIPKSAQEREQLKQLIRRAKREKERNAEQSILRDGENSQP